MFTVRKRSKRELYLHSQLLIDWIHLLHVVDSGRGRNSWETSCSSLGPGSKRETFSGPSKPDAVYTYILFSLPWQVVTFPSIDLMHNSHTVTLFNSPMGNRRGLLTQMYLTKLLLVVKSSHWFVCVSGDDEAFLPPIGWIGLLTYLSRTEKNSTCACRS